MVVHAWLVGSFSLNSYLADLKEGIGRVIAGIESIVEHKEECFTSVQHSYSFSIAHSATQPNFFPYIKRNGIES